MSATFWTLDRVSAALESLAVDRLPRGPQQLTGVSTDTRAIKPGQLFVALVGDNFDAHDFLEQAVQQGAAALVVSKPVAIGRVSVPVFTVHDTRVALGALARYWRRAWGKTVVAIAGSNGKTSTKELVRAALGARFEVHATTGNLNNQIGVPLTLLAMPASAEIAVIEMGTDHPGEVDILRDIAEPDIAVVTSIGEEHLEWLGDLAGVLREESRAYFDVSVGVAPAAQPEIGEAGRPLAQRMVVAGLDNGDVRPTAWRMSPDGLGEIEIDGVTVKPPVRGAHNLRNAMLAIAVARECGVPMDDVARGIAAMPLPSMRTAWQTMGKATLINDAYNANPPSARAAIELLAGSGDGRQRVLVLGTMRELGPTSAQLHEDVAHAALGARIDIIGALGDFVPAFEKLAPGDARVVTAADIDSLWNALAPRVKRDAVILLKASRGVKLERLVPTLEQWAAAG